MKVTAKDVLAFSKAGYTAEQIDAYVTELENLPDDAEEQEEGNEEENESSSESSEEEKGENEETELEQKLKEENEKLKEELKKAQQKNTRRALPDSTDAQEEAYKDLCNKISQM